MKYLVQKPGHFWWMKNIRYFIYFIREFSGVLIAFYILSLLLLSGIHFFGGQFVETEGHPLRYLAQNLSSGIQSWIMWVGLTGAIVHSLTWLYVMPQILPFSLTMFQQKIAYVFLLGAWLGISYLILWLL